MIQKGLVALDFLRFAELVSALARRRRDINWHEFFHILKHVEMNGTVSVLLYMEAIEDEVATDNKTPMLKPFRQRSVEFLNFGTSTTD